MMVLPMPERRPPPEEVWVGWVWAGMGLEAVGACLGGGAGDDDLPDDLPLDPPPRGMNTTN